MLECEKCEKIFKTKWHLQRHYSKKIPCNFSPPIGSFSPPIGSLNCEYCLQNFSRIDALNRHSNTCRDKNDIVRYLERQLDIQIEKPKDNECRFCNRVFSQKTNCYRHLKVCKAKLIYRNTLEVKIKTLKQSNNINTSHNVYNNTYNDNRVTNNVINCLGNENMSYITTKVLKQLWKEVKSDEEGFAKTIKIIHAHKDHPENHNIIFTNMRSNTALVKVNDKFEYKNIHDILKDISTNTLDMIVLSTEFGDLQKNIKEKYEKVCEDDELNQQATCLAKTELYNSYKKGEVKRP